MSLFLAAPVTLTEGTLIVAKVEAQNVIGYGLISDANTIGINVQTKPHTPTDLPVRDAQTTDTFIIANYGPSASDKTGGSSVTSYILLMDGTAVVGDSSDSLVNTFNVSTGITSGQAYSFTW